PAEAEAGPRGHEAQWPERQRVRNFAAEADRQVLESLASADLERPGDPLLDRAEAVFTILEHEAMHQETLLYMWHRLPLDWKRRPIESAPLIIGNDAPAPRRVTIAAGRATLGARRERIPFGWDNEFPQIATDVPAFDIDVDNVTNDAFLRFIEAGGYNNPAYWDADGWVWQQEQRVTHPLFWERHNDQWYWRGQFELIPLPLAWPVY